MNIYLAGSYRRMEEFNFYAEDLRKLGHSVPARWLTGTHSDATPETRQAASTEDLEDITEADVFVCFTEFPSVGYLTGGRHIEFGFAYAQGKQIVIVGPRENVFYWRPETEDIYQFDTWSEALNYIASRWGKPDPEDQVKEARFC